MRGIPCRFATCSEGGSGCDDEPWRAAVGTISATLASQFDTIRAGLAVALQAQLAQAEAALASQAAATQLQHLTQGNKVSALR